MDTFIHLPDALTRYPNQRTRSAAISTSPIAAASGLPRGCSRAVGDRAARWRATAPSRWTLACGADELVRARQLCRLDCKLPHIAEPQLGSLPFSAAALVRVPAAGGVYWRYQTPASK